jgi:hypothetical protein
VLQKEIKMRTYNSNVDKIQNRAIEKEALESKVCPLKPMSEFKTLLSFLAFLTQLSFHSGDRNTFS